jgi:hypothetical protein
MAGQESCVRAAGNPHARAGSGASVPGEGGGVNRGGSTAPRVGSIPTEVKEVLAMFES